MSDTDSNVTRNWKEREVGALWVQKSAKGQKYMTGHISIDAASDEKHKLVIFENSGKKDESGQVKNVKAPDFRVYLSESPQQGSSDNKEAAEASAAATSTPDTSEEVIF